MAFESLSEVYTFAIKDFPPEWLPLTYLYDPDLPLYPIQYFHVLDPSLADGERPGERDRIFGFIHHINLTGAELSITIVTNKDLSKTSNKHFFSAAEVAVRNRLGLGNPVRLTDLDSCLQFKLLQANDLVRELWYTVIDSSFGKALPFGQIWDPVLGLARFVASWNSEGGRKGELIQTHSFAADFGVKIQPGNNVYADFYLLPTFEELRDITNPLNIFPKFAELVIAADLFTREYCSTTAVNKHNFSSFNLSKVGAGKKLKTSVIMAIIDQAPAIFQKALFNNYSVFDRGPQRSIIFLMMLHDLRHSFWDPLRLTPNECGELYTRLKSTYQTPKVIQLYAQQCFACEGVLPIDNWVKTFLRWPFEFRASKSINYYNELFECSDRLGKLERLIWISAQARKVHSSVCADILWCIRYGAPKEDNTIFLRGANPLSCKICSSHIRKVCPSYKNIAGQLVSFNNINLKQTQAQFNVITSMKENTTLDQDIESCDGHGTKDVYSTKDRSDGYKKFPVPKHDGSNLEVQDFIALY